KRESTLMNSREKGKRGERQWRDELRAQGFAARRGQQFSGSPDSPDVVWDSLPSIRFEVKAVERLNIGDAREQARRAGGRLATGGKKILLVEAKRNFREGLVTMKAGVFFKFRRGDFGAEGPRKADLSNVAREVEPKILGRQKGLPRRQQLTKRKSK